MTDYQQPPRERKRGRPFDAARLRALAIAYVGKYATNSGKLRAYLKRKLGERGWEGEDLPPVDDIVGQCAALGYVDDEAFAAQRAASLSRRGFGPIRIRSSLRAAHVDAQLAAQTSNLSGDEAIEAALVYARRKRFVIGDDPATNRKMIAAFLRAGHNYDIVRRIIDQLKTDDDDSGARH